MKHLLAYILILLFSTVAFSQNQEYITNKEYREYIDFKIDSLVHNFLRNDNKYKSKVNKAYKAYKWSRENGCNNYYYDSYYYNNRIFFEKYITGDSLLEIYKRVYNDKDTSYFSYDTLIKIFPDKFIWCKDKSIDKSWGTFLTTYYFSNPYFNDYPVYGINSKQLKDYLQWKYHKKEIIIDTINYNLNIQLPSDIFKFTNIDLENLNALLIDSTLRVIYTDETGCEDCLLDFNKCGFSINEFRVNWYRKINWFDEETIWAFRSSKVLIKDSLIDIKRFNKNLNYNYIYKDYYKNLNCYYVLKNIPQNPDPFYSDIYTKIPINLTDKTILYPFVRTINYSKDTTEINYNSYSLKQLHGLFCWKAKYYKNKDVLYSFTPYYSEKNYTDKTLELIQNKELNKNFYSFMKTIPVIIVKH